MFVFGLLVVMGFVFAGCAKDDASLMKNNMAELTKSYFYGESETVYASLSVGQREENYVLDGCCSDVVDFALLVVSFENEVTTNTVEANVKTDDKIVAVQLEKNETNGKYMFDLEKSVSADAKIELQVQGQVVFLQAISNEFVIDCYDAVEIACREFDEKIKPLKKRNNLFAEGYLRIMDKKANDFDGVFWCFTLLSQQNESWSVIISTEDGSILAKSN